MALPTWVAVGALLVPDLAGASRPDEKVVCPVTPGRTPLTEAEARSRFGADDYILVRFKRSKGGCHEFYAVAHDGTVVEAYLDPISGAPVRVTRIPPAR